MRMSAIQRRWRRGGTCLLAAALIGTLAACGGSSNAGGSSDNGESATGGEPAKPDQIVVRSWGPPFSSGLEETAAATFTAETGIEVVFDLTDNGEVQAKVRQAVQANQRPPVDVVHTIGILAEQASLEGLTHELDPSIVTHFEELTQAGKPQSGSTDYVNVYSYTFPVIYNEAARTLPDNFSWLDLSGQEFDRSFVMAATYEVLLFPVAEALGIDVETDDLEPLWETLETFRPSACGAGMDVEFVQLVQSGECDSGAFIAGNAFALEDAGVEVSWLVPQEGVTYASDSMYVAAGLPDDVAYWSQVFIDHVIEADNLTTWTAATGVIPTNTNSQPREDMIGDPAFPFTDEEIAEYGIPIPLDTAARLHDEWQERYEAAIRR